MSNYNEFAEEYAKQTASMEEETRASFRSLLPELAGKSVLDVGCGSGHDAQYYSDQGAIVSGIDVSDKEVEMARSRECGDFRVGDMNSLPYSSNSFDIVTSVYALQSSSDVGGAISEMIKVAKPIAPIVILTKHPFRNFLEAMVNDGNLDYSNMRYVTSYIFNRSIKLNEPGHTMGEYLSGEVLSRASVEHFSEHSDFPASENVIKGSNYPTYMVLGFRKKQQNA